MSEAVSPGMERPKGVLKLPLSVGVIASALVVLGAAIGLFAVVADYYRESDNAIGLTQFLLLMSGLAIMCAGIALQVRNKAYTLAEVGKFALIAGQLAILTQVIRLYQIEARIFYDVVALLILFGFIANHFVLPTLRPPLFFAIGVGVILAVLLAVHPVAAGVLIGFALLLFTIANLPLRLHWRVALLLVAAAGLAALHIGWMQAEWSSVVVPLVASMFMFRLIVYMYDLHNGRGPKGLWVRLSYFFLPPNPIFPFFPVVDFSAFGRSYYSANALEIYQRGVNMILRGVIHLLLYRIVYHHFTLAPETLSSPSEFLQFIVTNFALYLRISGLFHLIVGLLLLFGFNLHETHSRFYFSSSFIDFWRRINIYWKDFMQKIFFNPAFTRMKKLGASHMASVLGAIAIVFVCTWALHAYQWFWMRGSFLFTWPDLLFWVLLGAFLMVQTYVEELRPKRKAVAASGLLGPRVFLALRTICTFLTICVLWSFWTSDSIVAWLEMLGECGIMPVLAPRNTANLNAWLTTLLFAAIGLFMLLVTLGVSFGLGAPATHAKRAARPAPMPLGRQAAIAAAFSFVLLSPHGFTEAFPIRAQLFVEEISANRLNTRDQAALTRGYYEDLTNTNRFNSPLWEALMFRPVVAQVPEDQPGLRPRDDYLRFDFRPLSIVEGIGGTARINRWGMRDQDYALDKPDGVVRIAVSESSRAAGLGVRDEDLFETRLETRLNVEYAASGHRFEVLNFAIHGHLPLQRLYLLEQRMLRFEPDVVIYIGGPRESSAEHIAVMYRRGIESPYPIVRDVIARAGLRREMSQARMETLLAPYHEELLAFVYTRFAAVSRDHGTTPVYVYLPVLDGIDSSSAEAVATQRRLAANAGFVMLNVDDVYAGQRREDLQLTPNDFVHPNGYGHGLVADRLYAELVGASNRIDLTPHIFDPLR